MQGVGWISSLTRYLRTEETRAVRDAAVMANIYTCIYKSVRYILINYEWKVVLTTLERARGNITFSLIN